MLIKVNVNGFWLKGRVNGRGWIQMIQTESRWLGESSQSGIGDQVRNCAVTWWLLVNILTYVRRSLRFVQWRMIQLERTALMELTARLGFYPSNGLLIGGKLPLLVESWQEQTGAENLNIEVSCVTVKNRAAAGSAKFFFFFFFFLMSVDEALSGLMSAMTKRKFLVMKSSVFSCSVVMLSTIRITIMRITFFFWLSAALFRQLINGYGATMKLPSEHLQGSSSSPKVKCEYFIAVGIEQNGRIRATAMRTVIGR